MRTLILKNEIKKVLNRSVDYKYKDFCNSLCPGIDNILGVRIPVIRNFAKDLLLKYSFEEFYKQIDNEYYEEIMLKGILIDIQKGDISKTKKINFRFFCICAIIYLLLTM